MDRVAQGVAVGADVGDPLVVDAHLGAGGVQSLDVDLVLPLDERAGVVVALPDHEVLVHGRVVDHLGVGGVEVRVAVGAHVGEPDVVGPHLGAVRGEPLAVDLVLVEGLVAAPHDEVLVRDGVVGHGRINRVLRHDARGAGARDGEDPAEGVPPAVQEAPEDLPLAGDRRVALPHGEVLIGGRVVGQRDVDRAEGRVAGRPLIGDPHLRAEGLGRRGHRGEGDHRARQGDPERGPHAARAPPTGPGSGHRALLPVGGATRLTGGPPAPVNPRRPRPGHRPMDAGGSRTHVR